MGWFRCFCEAAGGGQGQGGTRFAAPSPGDALHRPAQGMLITEPARPLFPPRHHNPKPNPFFVSHLTIKIVPILTLFILLGCSRVLVSAEQAQRGQDPAPSPSLHQEHGCPSCPVSPRPSWGCSSLPAWPTTTQGWHSFSLAFSATLLGAVPGLHCSSRAGAGRGSRSCFQPCPMLPAAPAPSQSPRHWRGSPPPSSRLPAQLSAPNLTHATSGFGSRGAPGVGELARA